MRNTAQPGQDSDTEVTTIPERAAEERRGERGQGMVEYALILILIFMAVLVAVQVLGHSTSSLYSNIASGVSTATGH